MNCSLMNLHGFLDGLDSWNLSVQPHWHNNHLVNVLLLWALGVYGKLFVLRLYLVSFSAPSF